jgi:hypothetical protein
MFFNSQRMNMLKNNILNIYLRELVFICYCLNFIMKTNANHFIYITTFDAYSMKLISITY